MPAPNIVYIHSHDTGQWAHSCGMTGLVNRGWTLPHPERLLTHTLRKAGYTTAMAFPTMKCNLTDPGIGVLLVMRGPGGFRGGQVVDALVSQIDIYPTVCGLAGTALPGHAQGTSLLPLVNGQKREILEDLRRRLDQWMQNTGDPLCQGGSVVPPATEVINDPDALSPSDPHHPCSGRQIHHELRWR